MYAPAASAERARRAAQDERHRLRMAALAGAALFVLCCMDLSQLLFAAMGAAAYLAICALGGLGTARQGRGPEAATPSASKEPLCAKSVAAPAPPAASPPPAQPPRRPSQKPVMPPTFCAVGFEAEVEELVQRMARTSGSQRAVQHIVRAVERVVLPVLPEASVVGFVNTDISCGMAFRVAVPEIDIVICASPLDIAGLTRDLRPPELRGAREVKDPSKLAKATLRMFADRLLAAGGFKFRRSAFRSDEPKVTLLAPPEAGGTFEATPVELSLNSATPGFDAALLAECGRLDPRARALALLVRRWAKDRGACHAARGHLPPYAWTLLAIYYLQVGAEEGPVLPPVSAFRASSALASRGAAAAGQVAAPGVGAPSAPRGPRQSVGRLFQDFLRFYAERFDFGSEAVAVWNGARGPPCASQVAEPAGLGDDAPAAAAPVVEDPFNPARNLGLAMSDGGLEHLHKELRRATSLCSAGASLSELLTPWAPPGDGAMTERA